MMFDAERFPGKDRDDVVEPNPVAIPCAVDESAAKYLHVEDPNYVEPETVTTTTHSTGCLCCGFAGSLKEIADHNCPFNPDDIPNRFDPYEALDTILDLVVGLGFGPGHSIGDGIQEKVYALRAYITGMEK